MGCDANHRTKFIDAVNIATASLAEGKICPGIKVLNTEIR